MSFFFFFFFINISILVRVYAFYERRYVSLLHSLALLSLLAKRLRRSKISTSCKCTRSIYENDIDIYRKIFFYYFFLNRHLYFQKAGISRCLGWPILCKGLCEENNILSTCYQYCSGQNDMCSLLHL